MINERMLRAKEASVSGKGGSYPSAVHAMVFPAHQTALVNGNRLFFSVDTINIPVNAIPDRFYCLTCGAYMWRTVMRAAAVLVQPSILPETIGR